MLKKIEINQFKSLRDVETHFGKVNLFIGPNGSGKSNILEAIGVLASALDRGISESDLSKKGVRVSRPAVFKSSFKNHKLPISLKIKATFDNNIEYALGLSANAQDAGLKIVTESGKFNKRTLLGRSGHGSTVLGRPLSRRPLETRSLWDQTRTLTDYNDIFSDELTCFQNFAIYSPQTEFLRGTAVGSVDAPPIGLHGEGLAAALRTLVPDRESLDDKKRRLFERFFSIVWLPGWATEVRIEGLDPELAPTDVKTGENTVYFIDRFMHSKRNKLTAYDSSEGTLFLLFIAVCLLHRDMPKIFALDNVDNALNPAMTTKVVKKIIEATLSEQLHNEGIGPKQVFMTSHNPSSIDGIDIFNPDTRVFVVTRTRDGSTAISRLEPPSDLTKEQWIKRHNGRNLSELWIDGLIPGALGEVDL